MVTEYTFDMSRRTRNQTLRTYTNNRLMWLKYGLWGRESVARGFYRRLHAQRLGNGGLGSHVDQGGTGLHRPYCNALFAHNTALDMIYNVSSHTCVRQSPGMSISSPGCC